MNYSRNFSRAAVAKRVSILGLAVAIISGLIGSVLGYALKTHITAKQTANGGSRQIHGDRGETLVYGAYDDRIFTYEMSLDWGSGDLLTPLDCDMPEDIQEFVYYICAGYNLDFTLVMALIAHESEFDPDVISSTNDYGYMQINVINHEWLTETLGVTDYLDPYQNIRAGVLVLRKLFERYQDTNMVLMAYNMGETAASRLWEQGIFETDYTQSILTIQQKYNAQLESGD